MQRKGKLTRFESMNKSFTNSMGKTLYKFKVEFDNGDVGEANSATENASSWKLNTEYNYELTQNGNYTNITGMKSADYSNQKDGFKKSYYDDPKVQARITKAFAIDAAATYLNLPHVDKSKITKEHLKSVATNIEKYIYHGLDANEGNSEALLDKRKAVEVALKLTVIPCYAITNFEGLIAICEDCMNILKA